MPDSRDHPLQRILIVRPSALGDVCRTVPVAASLRRALPRARIEWVVQDAFVEAVAAHPAVDEVIAFPRRRFARWWRDPAAARDAARWISDLRQRRFDLVLDGQGLGRSGMITALSGAPRRIGPATAREFAWLAYTDRVPVAHRTHTVDQMLALVEAIGIEAVRDMRLALRSTDAQWWAEQRGALGLIDGRYAVLAPAARWASKCWPIERWSALVNPLRDLGFSRCIVIGSPGERQQIQPLLEAHESIIDLVGAATIGRAMAIIAGCGLLIGNDSAPLHMAAGLDRPCVGLYGPTDPARVGPCSERAAVVSAFPKQGDGAPPHYRDRKIDDAFMRRIRVEAVLDAACSVLPLPPSGRIGRTESPASSVAERDDVDVRQRAAEATGP